LDSHLNYFGFTSLIVGFIAFPNTSGAATLYEFCQILISITALLCWHNFPNATGVISDLH